MMSRIQHRFSSVYSNFSPVVFPNSNLVVDLKNEEGKEQRKQPVGSKEVELKNEIIRVFLRFVLHSPFTKQLQDDFVQYALITF